jgi:hypothetical protein
VRAVGRNIVSDCGRDHDRDGDRDRDHDHDHDHDRDCDRDHDPESDPLRRADGDPQVRVPRRDAWGTLSLLPLSGRHALRLRGRR